MYRCCVRLTISPSLESEFLWLPHGYSDAFSGNLDFKPYVLSISYFLSTTKIPPSLKTAYDHPFVSNGAFHAGDFDFLTLK